MITEWHSGWSRQRALMSGMSLATCPEAYCRYGNHWLRRDIMARDDVEADAAGISWQLSSTPRLLPHYTHLHIGASCHSSHCPRPFCENEHTRLRSNRACSAWSFRQARQTSRSSTWITCAGSRLCTSTLRILFGFEATMLEDPSDAVSSKLAARSQRAEQMED